MTLLEKIIKYVIVNNRKSNKIDEGLKTEILNNFNNLYDLEESIYLIKNLLTDKKQCLICHNKTRFVSFSKGYNKTCSRRCAGILISHDPIIKDKKKKTSLERYGFESHTQNKNWQLNDVSNRQKNGSYIKGLNTFKERFGVENVFQLESSKQKIKQTNLERYGVENPNQCQQIKDKIYATNLERYGSVSPLGNELIKQKIKQTNLERYGVENPNQCQQIKDKIYATNLERYGYSCSLSRPEIITKARYSMFRLYGVDHGLQSIDVRNKIKSLYLKKYGVPYKPLTDEQSVKMKYARLKKYGVESMFSLKYFNDMAARTRNKNHIEKYGVKYPWNRKEVMDKCKATNLTRYGVEYAAQNPAIFKQMTSNRNRSAFSYKNFVSPSGKTITYQGYEKYVLEYLYSIGIQEDDIENDVTKVPTIKYFFDGKNRIYYPDIFIKSKNLLIEVKSTYTFDREIDKNLAKQKGSKESGYDHWILIWSVKNNWIEDIFKVGL